MVLTSTTYFRTSSLVAVAVAALAVAVSEVALVVMVMVMAAASPVAFTLDKAFHVGYGLSFGGVVFQVGASANNSCDVFDVHLLYWHSHQV